MSADLGFSEAVYGFGAGIFFVGYLLLEIPGALIVERWSARLWMSRILITWGLCTILVGFARTPVQFYGARFCLGLAEAGFFPGVLVYLTHWFAPGDRARAMSSFILAVPISFVIGAPLSAFCLSLHWFGLAGWQWLFILQGLPAVFFGILTPFYLIDRPADARWLHSAERDWLSTELKRERERKRLLGHFSVRSVLGRGSVWILAAALFFVVLSSYGYILWLPSTIQRESGLSVKASTLLSALPFCAAVIMVKLMGRSSDRSGKHKLHAALPLFAAGLLFACVAIPDQPFPLTMLWLGIGESQKIAIVFMGSWIYILLYTIESTKRVDPLLIRAARNLGAGDLAVMWHVILPGALPGIIAGLKVTLAISWSCVLSAEMIAAQNGLGALIWQGKDWGNLALVLVGMLCISIVVLAADKLADILERLLLPWERHQRS